MSFRIDTTTGRAKLQSRREPYWSRISAGAYVGFRKLADGEGTWVARWRSEEGKQHYRALGHHGDYDSAVKDARHWFVQCEGGTFKVVAVAEVCRQYVEDRRARKGEAAARDADGRFGRHVYHKRIGQIDIAQLKAADIERWLHGLVRREGDAEAERRSKDSANRDLSALKAALNLAFRSGLAASDAQWRRVKSFEGVGRRREGFLPLPARKALLLAASPELERLIRAVALTAARPGEIATASVRDHDPGAGTLTLCGGKAGRRTVPVSVDALRFFTECAKDRNPSDPLIARQTGVVWDRFAWRDAMREAVTQARLPAGTVLYSIRHAAISEMLIAGIDPLSVARLAGTSVTMISKHYGHLVQDHVRAQLSRVKML